ncbi:hypothetical protein AQ616_08165 [Oceanobacillus sp. E9]|nr:hypothetical protein AQ616_08165 [Oceanobacillus sp. E9]
MGVLSWRIEVDYFLGFPIRFGYRISLFTTFTDFSSCFGFYLFARQRKSITKANHPDVVND